MGQSTIDIPKGYSAVHSIDNSFIDELEGYSSKGYIPKGNKGEILGNSGVTIGSGVDLGQYTERLLKELNVSRETLEQIRPYIGKKGLEADKFLRNNPLEMQDENIKDIQNKVRENNFSTYIDYYENKTGKDFNDLPENFQTSIGSVITQYGPSLEKRTPNFNENILNNDIKGARQELNNFGDKYPTRRKKEASLLDKLSSLNPFSVSEASAEELPQDVPEGYSVVEENVPEGYSAIDKPMKEKGGILDPIKGFFKGGAAGISGIPQLGGEALKASGSSKRILGERLLERYDKGELYDVYGRPIPKEDYEKSTMVQLAKKDADRKIAEGKKEEEKGSKIIKENEDFQKKVGINIESLEGKGDFAYKLGHGATSILSSIGLYAVTGGSATPALAFGAIQAISVFNESIESGKSLEESYLRGFGAGGAEAALEGVGLNFIMKKYGGKLTSAIIRGTENGIQEGLQTSAENIATLGLEGRGKDILAGTGESALIGFILGGGSSAISEKIVRDKLTKQLEGTGIDPKDIPNVVDKIMFRTEESVKEVVDTDITEDLKEPKEVVEDVTLKPGEDAERKPIDVVEDVTLEPGEKATVEPVVEEVAEVEPVVKKEEIVEPEPTAITEKPKKTKLEELKQKKIDKELLSIKRTPETAQLVKDIKPVESPKELVERINQLNKFAQSRAILRKAGGGLPKRAAGLFAPKGKDIAKEGEVRLRKETISNASEYMSTLSHELGHALEWNMLGTIDKNTLDVFGDTLTKEEQNEIHKELIGISKNLVGESEYTGKLQYYSKKTELLARFLEKMFVSPGDMMEIAPKAMEMFEKQSIKHPIVREYIEAVLNNIDKGAPKIVLLRDMRQTYQKHLGKRVGDIAYDEEIVHRAMQERGKFAIGKLIDKKFKNVKDDPETLFRAAESIKVTKEGVPEFGTRDFVTVQSEEEAKGLVDSGFDLVDVQIVDGIVNTKFAKYRYTPKQAKKIFESLSEEGKELIKGFTAARDEAKDYFNRETIKEVNKIESDIEGWVHHYFEDKPKVAGKKLRFREKLAGTRKQRIGVEGYVEDFKKAMHKVMIDLESEKVFNDFITRQFARVSKPIVEGQTPDAGWIEVVGKLKKGIGTEQEKKMVIIKDGKQFIPKQIRYQVPKEIYERYKLWGGLVDEASTAMRIVNDINRYWRINILTHPGSAATNFISGGIQYSSKVLSDFYSETLTGNIKYEKTRQNLSAMLKVLMPKGWVDAPDWIYGGDLSNYYGQFTEQQGIVDEAIQSYGNKALKLYGVVERYWKKTILTADKIGDLKQLGEMTQEGLRLPSVEERAMIAEINKDVDLYAYDYDNVPLWLANHNKSTIGVALKPFMKYPYKYMKHILNMAGAIFDRTQPLHERMAKLLTLSTIMAMYALFSRERKKKQETPEATVDIPARMSTRGRLYIRKDDEGKEIFVRVAKYPFVNLTEAGMQFADGNWESGKDIMSDMLGSLGPVGNMGMLALDYRSKYNQYTPVPVILGDSLATYMLGYRILNDVSRAMDPYKRNTEFFYQSFTKVIPTTNEDLQNKLHGKKRTVRIPIEGGVEKPDEEYTRTTVDKVLVNYSNDILLSLFTGIYQTRLDPKEVEAFIIRKEKNIIKKQKKEQQKKEKLQNKL